ncbi:Porphobilinogen deaminase [Streptomyces canarius]
MPVPELIRIVSRDSPMALAQVERVRAELAVLHPGVRTAVVPVKTTGDKWLGDLSQVEGKGAFTKEVDAALLAGEADLAVHCVKPPARGRPALSTTARMTAARSAAMRCTGASGPSGQRTIRPRTDPAP